MLWKMSLYKKNTYHQLLYMETVLHFPLLQIIFKFHNLRINFVLILLFEQIYEFFLFKRVDRKKQNSSSYPSWKWDKWDGWVLDFKKTSNLFQQIAHITGFSVTRLHSNRTNKKYVWGMKSLPLKQFRIFIQYKRKLWELESHAIPKKFTVDRRAARFEIAQNISFF